MATNPYITKGYRPEQNLYEDIVIESLQFYGQDVYYLPREIITQDQIFADEVESRFSEAYKVEMYIENIEGFDGEGDLFTKFGVEIRDQATFIVARKRWKNLIGAYLEENNFRPREGDIIYLPLSNSMFQIMKVETEAPFYQLNQLPTFRLRCELFEYNDEEFQTMVDEIDDVVSEGAYQYALTMFTADSARASATATINDQGEITGINLVSAGSGYITAPEITVSRPEFGAARFGGNSLNCLIGRGKEGQYSDSGAGYSEFFFFPTVFPDSNQQDALFISGGGVDSGGYVWGITDSGQIGYASVVSGMGGLQRLDSAPVLYGEWNHLLVGNIGTQKYAYLNGDKVYSDSGSGLPTVKGTYTIGVPAAGERGETNWGAFRGYIDEFRSVLTDSSEIASRYDGDSNNLIVPNAEFTEDSSTALLLHFNGQTAQLAAVIDSDTGVISSITIADSGEFYADPPDITIERSFTQDNFIIDEYVSQDNGEYVIKGKILGWSDSDYVMKLAHVGSLDGEFHTFTTTAPVVGQTSRVRAVPKLVGDIQNIQVNSANTVYDNFEQDFLDFSETNPFGDVS